MRQFSGFASPEETNDATNICSSTAAADFSVAFDLPTLMGYDSDHPASEGEVGKCGVAIDSLEDMEILFDGIDLEKTTVSMTINSPASVLWAMYLVVAEKQGADWKKISGTIQNDILKEYIAQKEYIFPPAPSMRLVIDTFEFGSKFTPRFNTISISGYHIREAGSTALQELAFTLYDGVEYVEWARRRGLDVDDFGPRLSFFFNAHNDFFEEIAKYRAARKIWYRVMKDRFGAKNQRTWLMRFHTQTAGVSLTGAAAEEQHRARRAAGIGRGAGRNTIAAHGCLRRSTRAAHRGCSAHCIAHPADHRLRNRGHADSGSSRRLVFPGESHARRWKTAHSITSANLTQWAAWSRPSSAAIRKRKLPRPPTIISAQSEAKEKIIVGVNEFAVEEDFAKHPLYRREYCAAAVGQAENVTGPQIERRRPALPPRTEKSRRPGAEIGIRRDLVRKHHALHHRSGARVRDYWRNMQRAAQSVWNLYGSERNLAAMRVVLAVLACTFLSPALGFAESQSVQDVTLCELRQHASEFNHKLVRVRGTADLAFETFVQYDPACKDANSTSVWLTFGGDVTDIAVYCCGDHSREPGRNIKIEGESVSLLKDPAFDQFYKLLRASRNRMPNGERCTGDCHLYSVTATLTGFFLAEKNTEKEHTGYGHLGCCSLLVIQQVTDLSAERRAVPAGAFACEKAQWEPLPDDVSQFKAYVDCPKNCDHEAEAAIARAASRWQDNLTIAKGRTERFGDATGAHPIEHLDWISDDLLTSYAIVAEKTNPPKYSVTREVCQSASVRYPALEAISCDDHATQAWSVDHQLKYEQLIVNKDHGKAEKMLVDWDEKRSRNGDQSWRSKPLAVAAHAILEREIMHWGIVTDSDLKADTCSEPAGLDDQQYWYASCSWYSPGGMQEFTVNLLVRKKGHSTSQHSPWLLNSASARVCHADPSLATAIIHPN